MELSTPPLMATNTFSLPINCSSSDLAPSYIFVGLRLLDVVNQQMIQKKGAAAAAPLKKAVFVRI